MFTVKIENSVHTMKIDSGNHVSSLDGNISVIHDLLADWHKVIPLSEVKLSRQVDPLFYNYKVTTLADAVWEQSLDFTIPSKPTMTFSVNDYWALAEFAPGREVRNFFARIIPLWDLETFKVTWY